MKIGILTYYGVHNHGAVLQANALKTVLEQKDMSVVFLSLSVVTRTFLSSKLTSIKLG